MAFPIYDGLYPISQGPNMEIPQVYKNKLYFGVGDMTHKWAYRSDESYVS